MNITSLLSKEIKLKEIEVAVPELQEDGTVIVREMAGSRLRGYLNAISNESNTDLIGIHLLVASCVDENGDRTNDHEDAEMIYESVPMAVLNRLIEAANEVNSRDTSDVRTKKKD